MNRLNRFMKLMNFLLKFGNIRFGSALRKSIEKIFRKTIIKWRIFNHCVIRSTSWWSGKKKRSANSSTSNSNIYWLFVIIFVKQEAINFVWFHGASSRNLIDRQKSIGKLIRWFSLSKQRWSIRLSFSIKQSIKFWLSFFAVRFIHRFSFDWIIPLWLSEKHLNKCQITRTPTGKIVVLYTMMESDREWRKKTSIHTSLTWNRFFFSSCVSLRNEFHGQNWLVRVKLL